MAFPNVQPNQSFTTKGLTAPIDMTKVDGQGNVVESYKAVPPGIADIPTGPNEGTMIETPASTYLQGGLKSKVKYQTGGENQALTLPDDDYGRMRQQAYADSLTIYNEGKKSNNWLKSQKPLSWSPASNPVYNAKSWDKHLDSIPKSYLIANNNLSRLNHKRPTPKETYFKIGYEHIPNQPINTFLPSYKKPVQPIEIETYSKLPLKEAVPSELDYQLAPTKPLALNPNAGYLTTDFGDTNTNVGERVQGRFNLEDNTWSQSIVDKDGNVVKTRRSDGTTTVPEEDEAKAPTPKKVKKRKLQQMPTFKKGGTKCYTCGGIKAKVR
jgi:hypothetical protein